MKPRRDVNRVAAPCDHDSRLTGRIHSHDVSVVWAQRRWQWTRRARALRWSHQRSTARSGCPVRSHGTTSAADAARRTATCLILLCKISRAQGERPDDGAGEFGVRARRHLGGRRACRWRASRAAAAHATSAPTAARSRNRINVLTLRGPNSSFGAPLNACPLEATGALH